MSAEHQHQEKWLGLRFVRIEDLLLSDIQEYLAEWRLEVVRMKDVFPEGFEPFTITLPSRDSNYTGGGLVRHIPVTLGAGVKGTPEEIISWDFSRLVACGNRFKLSVLQPSKALNLHIFTTYPNNWDRYNDMAIGMRDLEWAELDSKNREMTLRSRDASYKIESNGRHIFTHRGIPMESAFNP
ncbi:MAG: hypothetical protein UU73_C0001G0326 [Candidatus Daviesbacteria bacterium GW2011_GWA1_41_61]|uniref:Uncharacterized protein n=1 Tax=Candidatus Daviesbacteria bacterium GW2011_GWA2_40_9 TaxID=1618424 RepID=A0A0G0U5N1_9BACT|nr:MAG: hypothetical protein UU26_C0025G0012 [Candidatus Daviesbacteria bacterium GW2011_GWC1_40_9]KKR82496.1 MAG: hypothetical protein UU29_C0012G0034 [Candidatus Daviesbacteria bacterium GW2011_GWA2_40_9]KKR93145.1 MAG: hypothetical protein UU44_C0004G0327 [Candidatus Daviesbacteria bacterium GW2011_GWB1_41_15]KKS15689.1 MAG: hypothetical protein UU73_C0001G0326 [Candidatus Daviesbacteria bacterium GW2011_GWA1_41_61]